MHSKEPRNQIGYSLHRLTFILQRMADEKLQTELGIGFAQFKLLLGLSKHPGVEQQELAFYLGQSEASISRQLASMKRKHLVSVEKDKKDSRRRQVKLTKNGKNTFEKSKKLLESMHRQTVKQFKDSQIKQLNSLLEDMLRAVGCPEENIRG